jgi:hypothetical protein
MNAKPFTRILTAGICGLLLLEAAHFFWLSWSFAELFRAAANVSASDPLPDAVWTYAAEGCTLTVLALLYLWNLWDIRRWFVVIAGVSLVYGIWLFSQNYPVMFAWSGAFHGDVIAVEALSGVGFAGLGVLGLLARAKSS